MKNLIVKEGNRTGLLKLPDNKTYHGEIIWDDSKDGPIPEEFKGKERYLKSTLTLVDEKPVRVLSEDSAAKVISDNENQDEASRKASRDAKLLEFKDFDGSNAMSGAVLEKLLVHLGLK